jgi:hypothetical protein
VIDILFLSFINPYALLGGVLVYLFFYRFADKLEETRKGECDLGYVLIGISVLIGEIIFVITMWNANITRMITHLFPQIIHVSQT